VVLLLSWAFCAGTVLFAALRAHLVTRTSPRQSTATFLAVGVSAGVVGWATASVFLHLSDFRTLLLMAALAGALDVHARRLAVPGVEPALVERRSLRAVTVAGGVAAVTAAVGIVGVVGLEPPSYVNSATLAVVPSGSLADGVNAYQVDVISRGLIVPTLTEVLDRSVTARSLLGDEAAAHAELSVSVDQSRHGGSVVVTVSGRTRDAVTEAGDRAVALSAATVAGLDSSYSLTGSMGGARATQAASGRAALPLVPAALAGLVVWLVLRRRGRPAPRRASSPPRSRLREPVPSTPPGR
jgi:hypothetical protein